MKKETKYRLILAVKSFCLALFFLLHTSDDWSVIAVVACAAAFIARRAQGEG